jgi:fatty-acid peroxygenase
MIENAAGVGPRTWRALHLRRRCERWARHCIQAIRDGTLTPPDESPAGAIAMHRDLDGDPLDAQVAAIELLNLLRPTVAVAHFVVYAALALHEHPSWRKAFADGDESDLESFVQEVRRMAPFFPLVSGRVEQAFDWHGHRFERNDWLLLDLYGTCHDSRAWDLPYVFRPERFRNREPTPFDLIPQGGGDYHANHRCPGEWIAIELTKTFLRLLTRETRYDVPPQDLSVDLSWFPALPRSGFVMESVRPAERPHDPARPLDPARPVRRSAAGSRRDPAR